MKVDYRIQKLKTFAKRHARANRLPHIQSLDLVAQELCHAHWNALMTANKANWLPKDKDLTKIEIFAASALHSNGENEMGANPDPFEDMAQTDEGTIGEHSYQIGSFLDDAVVYGEGWTVFLPEAPLAAPLVEIDERYAETSPVNDLAFLTQVLKLARNRSQQIRSRMSKDWPRRSTKPDADGRVRHPLVGGESETWYCWDCDGKITGPQIAENLWHCPGCGANPLHICPVPYASDEIETHPIDLPGKADRVEPIVRLVEPKLKLELNEKNISLLIRCAMIEEADNPSERLGAMLAEISLIDKEVVYVSLDEDLWPEDKELTQALAVADLLGVEMEQEVTLFTAPFAWPGLGQSTSSTQSYTKLLLDAYSEHGVISR